MSPPPKLYGQRFVTKMLIPYQVDVPMARWPIANFAIIGLIVCVSLWGFAYGDSSNFETFVLDGWSPAGLFGHLFLHADGVHLIGNLIFLWVFGNAVCAKVGNVSYIVVFLGLGAAAAAVHNIMDSGPAIGASGAINGVVGAYLLLYPLNNVSCLWTLWVRAGSFSLSGFWMILMWLGFDIWGAVDHGDNVAYWAHLGGFAGGVIGATTALWLGWIRMTESEQSLLDVLGLDR